MFGRDLNRWVLTPVRTPSSCIRCAQPLAVESDGDLCFVCQHSIETSRSAGGTPHPTPAGADTHTAAPPARGGDALTASNVSPSLAAFGDRLAATDAPVGVDDTFSVSAAASHVKLPPSPPGYDLIRHLGGGGMGDVYLAREHVSERVVAMKFFRGGSGATDRFLVEVRALAALDHPNIVRVLATEFRSAQPFFTMEYAAGGTLGDRVRERGPLPPMDAARLLATAARAVGVAHDKDVLHRDLKPSNILLDASGEPKISDFGLAKRLDKDDGITVGSGALGTPGFMPPEQISKRNGEVGPWSDVYGLGATLYHVLTGRPPFTGDTPAETMHRVLVDVPTRPRLVRADIPAALEGIAVKCLEKETTDRYATAAALADDLERFLAGQQTAAPELTSLRRAKRWAGRNRARLATVAAIMAVTVLLVAAWPAPAPVPPTVAPPPDPRETMVRELTVGRPYTAIPEKGPPAYSRWLLGGVTFAKSDDGEGACAINTPTISYLELVPDPLTTEYVFQADVRHFEVSAPNYSQVGVFIGLHEGPDTYAMIQFGFTDFPIPPIQGQPIPNRFDCNRLVGHRHPDGSNNESPYGLGGTPPFAPSVGKPGPWHTIRVTVSAAGVNVSWGPDADQQTPLRKWTADELSTAYRDHRTQLAAAGRPIDGLPVAWSPRGGVGIWAMQSAGAFRNVSVRSIPPP